MSSTMRAARIHEPGRPVEVDEVPVPDIRGNEVLVKVLRAGANGGDLHMRDGDFSLWPGEESRQLPDLPMTIGHDGLGEIAALGEDVHDDLAVGDKVVLKCTLTCGVCRYCRTGRMRLCINHRVMGFFTMSTERKTRPQHTHERYKDGTFAEFCRIPATNVERLEPGDDVDEMCKVSVIGVGYRGLKRTSLGPGETVIINGGTGITGLPTVLAAMVMGAAHVIVVARNRDRLNYVESIDPDRISAVSILDGPIEERIRELTDGRGASVLADLTPSGTESTIECMKSLEPGGRIVLLGGNTEILEIGYRFFFANNFNMFADAGRYYVDFPELLESTRRGAIDVSPINTEYFELDDVNEALDRIESPTGPEPVWPMLRFE